MFPDAAAIAALAAFDQPLPEHGQTPEQVLTQLDEVGSPATVASNGPRYFGFVIGATLPAAAAAERLVLAWDQCASSFDNSPVADRLEKVAGRWVCEALGLPRESAVGFGTSATACTLACLSAARRTLLARLGWDFDADGLMGAPEIRVVLNQVLVRGDSDAQTIAIREAAQASGEVWFGPTVWQGRPAFRLSLSSWRTRDADVQALADLLLRLKRQL